MRHKIIICTITVSLLSNAFLDHCAAKSDGLKGSNHLPELKRFRLLYDGDDDYLASSTGDDVDLDEDLEEKDEKGTIAQMLDSALKEEFKHEEEKQQEVGKQFNETVSREEGTQETVVIISQKKEKERNRNATLTDADGSPLLSDPTTSPHHDHASSFFTSSSTTDTPPGNTTTPTKSSHVDLSLESDVDRIIDSHDNEYVLSKPNEEGSMGLTLDPQLIRDLGVLIATAALAALLMEAAGQPTINGYFIAGSLVGPGGLHWIKEIVQVQSVAQLGVQFLLFTLGLELSLSKLRAVRDVALLGGLLELVLMAGMGAAGAALLGIHAANGAFVGALVAMSSTSVVVKCLQETRSAHQLHAQITIGTLVLQDCVVGLLFAFMPVLASAADRGGDVGLSELAAVAGRVLITLSITCAIGTFIAAFILPAVAKTVSRFSQETFQISVLGFCLVCAMATTRLGISSEMGSFLAGILLSTTDHQEAILAAAEPASHLFLALFIASTGLTIAPAFLGEHILVLAAGVAVVITAKTLVIAGVVLLFRYPVDTAMAVGINLAQIGEFGFVLLSMANQQGLIGSQVYLLLMGTTALSLLLTPFLLQVSTRIIPRVKGNTGNDDPKRRVTQGITNGSQTPPPIPLSVETKQLTPQSIGLLGGFTTHRRSGHSRSSSGETMPV